jgi:radical SAM superfamily enzyme
MTLEEYVTALEACVRALPRHIVIHRMTGDGAKKDLIAPLWSGDKKRVLNTIEKSFALHNVEQGG